MLNFTAGLCWGCGWDQGPHPQVDWRTGIPTAQRAAQGVFFQMGSLDSREEQTEKILGNELPIPVDDLAVQ
jgi:hypothetical protein